MFDNDFPALMLEGPEPGVYVCVCVCVCVCKCLCSCTLTCDCVSRVHVSLLTILGEPDHPLLRSATAKGTW